MSGWGSAWLTWATALCACRTSCSCLLLLVCGLTIVGDSSFFTSIWDSKTPVVGVAAIWAIASDGLLLRCEEWFWIDALVEMGFWTGNETSGRCSAWLTWVVALCVLLTSWTFLPWLVNDFAVAWCFSTFDSGSDSKTLVVWDAAVWAVSLEGLSVSFWTGSSKPTTRSTVMMAATALHFSIVLLWDEPDFCL